MSDYVQSDVKFGNSENTRLIRVYHNGDSCVNVYERSSTDPRFTYLLKSCSGDLREIKKYGVGEVAKMSASVGDYRVFGEFETGHIIFEIYKLTSKKSDHFVGYLVASYDNGYITTPEYNTYDIHVKIIRKLMEHFNDVLKRIRKAKAELTLSETKYTNRMETLYYFDVNKKELITDGTVNAKVGDYVIFCNVSEDVLDYSIKEIVQIRNDGSITYSTICPHSITNNVFILIRELLKHIDEIRKPPSRPSSKSSEDPQNDVMYIPCDVWRNIYIFDARDAKNSIFSFVYTSDGKLYHSRKPKLVPVDKLDYIIVGILDENIVEGRTYQVNLHQPDPIQVISSKVNTFSFTIDECDESTIQRDKHDKILQVVKNYFKDMK